MAKNKYYKVEFTHYGGEKEIVELRTDRIEWSIDQWCRNRQIVDHKILLDLEGCNSRRLISNFSDC